MKNKHFAFLAVFLAASSLIWAASAPVEVSPETNIFSFEFASRLGGLMFWAALLGRAYQAIRNGGGLHGIWNGLMFGTNVPKPVAQDYKDTQDKPNKTGAAVLSFLILLAAGGLVATTFTGCQTIQAWLNTSDDAKIAKISSTVTGLSSAGVSATIAKNPETKVYFQAAAELLQVAVGEGTTNPDAIRGLIIKAFDGKADGHEQIVTSSLGVVLGLYQAFYGLNVSNAVDSKPAFRAVLTGLVQGIKAGSGDAASSSGRTYDLSIDDLKLSR